MMTAVGKAVLGGCAGVCLTLSGWVGTNIMDLNERVSVAETVQISVKEDVKETKDKITLVDERTRTIELEQRAIVESQERMEVLLDRIDERL